MRDGIGSTIGRSVTATRWYTPRRVWLGIALGFIFLEGLGGQLLGPLLPVLREEFGVSASLSGTAGTVNTVCFVVAVVLTGGALGFLRPKRTLLLGFACIVAALGAMAAAPLFVVFLGGLAARALGTGVVRGVDKPVLSHLFPRQRDRLLNVYELTWAVGAAAAPVLATLAVSHATWEAAYVLVLVCTVPLVGLVLITPLPVAEVTEQPLSRTGLQALVGDRRLRGMTVALLLSGGIEGGLFLWLPTYLGEYVSATTANLAFSAYFLTYVPARIFHTLFAPRIGPLRVLLGSGFGTVALFAYGFSLGEGVGVVVALALSGFFVAGMFPLLSAYGISGVPERSGPVNGLSLGASYAGGSLSPLVVGLLIEQYSIGVGVQLFTVYAIALTVVLGWMWVTERRRSPSVVTP